MGIYKKPDGTFEEIIEATVYTKEQIEQMIVDLDANIEVLQESLKNDKIKRTELKDLIK